MFVAGNVATEMCGVATDADRLIRAHRPAAHTVTAGQKLRAVRQRSGEYKMAPAANAQQSTVKRDLGRTLRSPAWHRATPAKIRNHRFFNRQLPRAIHLSSTGLQQPLQFGRSCGSRSPGKSGPE